ncbi:hypothetical protein ACLMJK_005798 [Lecanora helva]
MEQLQLVSMDFTWTEEIEDSPEAWTDEMVELREKYKDREQKAKAARDRYLAREKQAEQDIETPPPADLGPDESRPAWLFELQRKDHADVLDIVMDWRDNMAKAIEYRIQFHADYPKAFQDDEKLQGHLQAINVASMEHCKVVRRVCDHMLWRNIPYNDNGEGGERPSRWMRLNRATTSHYGQDHAPSESEPPQQERQRNDVRSQPKQRRLNRSDP